MLNEIFSNRKKKQIITIEQITGLLVRIASKSNHFYGHFCANIIEGFVSEPVDRVSKYMIKARESAIYFLGIERHMRDLTHIL